MYKFGQANQQDLLNPVIVRSIIITNESGGALGLNLKPYSAAQTNPTVRIVAADDVTNSVSFDGIVFPDGLSIIPDAGLTYYGVEYDEYKPGEQISK